VGREWEGGREKGREEKRVLRDTGNLKQGE